VTFAGANVIPYDKLLLAPARSRCAAIPGLQLPGVRTFRDIADVDAMIAASTQHGRRRW